MPALETITVGTPIWVDLQTSDADRARTFYAAVLGWQAQQGDPSFGGYFNFAREGSLVAGCMTADAQAPVSDIWSVYLAVDDAAKTIEAATGAGAQVIVPADRIGDLGTFGFFVDPTGAAVGVWQAGQHKGFGIVGEHGAPGWFELYTRDYAGALAFYTEVFGWRTQVLSDTDEFRYSVVLGSGEDQAAGVMDAAAWLPEGVPPHWAVYFGVDDCDAAVAAVREHGGTVMEGPSDTPYGRIAHVTDPMGANFRLVAPNEQMPAREA